MKLLKTGWHYILNYKISAMLYIIFTLFSSILALILPVLFGQFVNIVVSNETYNKMFYFIILYFCVSFLQLILKYISSVLYCKVQAKSANDYNCRLIEILHSKKYSSIKSIDPIYYSQRINNDCNTIIIFCLSCVQNVTSSILNLLIPFSFIYLISSKLFIFLLLIILIYYFSYKFIKNKVYDMNTILINQKTEYFSQLTKQLLNIKIIIVNSISYKLMINLKKTFNTVFNTILRYTKLISLLSSIDDFINLVGQIFILFFCGYQIINSDMEIGTFTIINTYYSLIISSLSFFFNFGKTLQEANAALGRNQELDIFLNEPTENKTIMYPVNSIKLENLSFSYGKKNILKEFNYTFINNNVYCLVGKNGVGKSTLFDIILGLYNSECSGNIKINGINIQESDLTFYRKHCISICDQEISFLMDTIEDEFNLYNLSIDEIKKLLLSIQIRQNIDVKPVIDLLDRVKNTKKTNQFSKGEKQILLILKTFLSKKSVLLFDEPTSALDNKNIELFITLSNHFKFNHIILIITHDERIINRINNLVSFESD